MADRDDAAAMATLQYIAATAIGGALWLPVTALDAEASDEEARQGIDHEPPGGDLRR